jgi:hypothetical protein
MSDGRLLFLFASGGSQGSRSLQEAAQRDLLNAHSELEWGDFTL